MTHVFCFYISGHGFGHATRALQLAIDLLSQSTDSRVYLVTNAAEFIFEDGLKQFPNRLIYKNASIDAGVIQPLAYTVDREATIRQLGAFISSREEKLKEQIEFLKQVKATCILVDAPFLPCKAGGELGIKTMIVSNFTFDEIYLGLANGDSLDSTIHSLSQIAVEDYSHASVLIRLPGAIRIPSFAKGNEKLVSFHEPRTQNEKERLIVDTPLIFRKFRSSKEETCKQLGIPPSEYQSKKILLLSFGGQSLNQSGWEGVLPEGWICITCGMEKVNYEGFYSAGKECYAPDLVNAADVVLGKLGYGTVSECIGHSKPMVFVPRAQFIEEVGLYNLMVKEGSCVSLSIPLFESFQWKNAILEASTLPGRSPPSFTRLSIDGSPTIASWILNHLSKE